MGLYSPEKNGLEQDASLVDNIYNNIIYTVFYISIQVLNARIIITTIYK